jgi:flagellar hook assembly protein FlgD
MRGQKVRTLVTGHAAAGEHSVVWDGKDDQGRVTASGVYFYRLDTCGKVLTKKMLLLK